VGLAYSGPHFHWRNRFFGARKQAGFRTSIQLRKISFPFKPRPLATSWCLAVWPHIQRNETIPPPFQRGGYRIFQARSYPQFSKIHILKKYLLFFTTRILFYSTLFLNSSCLSYSKFILYFNYHTYFIIFYTTNFLSLIPILTTIIFHSIFHNSISNYPIII
jgi:hypothetical protein